MLLVLFPGPRARGWGEAGMGSWLGAWGKTIIIIECWGWGGERWARHGAARPSPDRPPEAQGSTSKITETWMTCTFSLRFAASFISTALPVCRICGVKMTTGSVVSSSSSASSFSSSSSSAAAAAFSASLSPLSSSYCCVYSPSSSSLFDLDP